ncbi:uncharacterized protein LOC111915914 isoform X1 [Lactuca sativa]|uniref:Protein kinase domain-containing protein n=1 Tax=Lactuca sativa TaxID=4236 RepID=A0A9R1XY54_LACSA|nr:uncharacterized protein LOC111915914 isoform X1 [Lactuca sativa]KAJ0226712.1 hypothetical protein LSAT_V11C100029150 [Lactuca sativa]
MTNEISGSSGTYVYNGITRRESDLDSRIRNLSVQTGEEFSPEFIRERTPRRIIQTTEECPQKVYIKTRSSRNLLENLEDFPLEYHQDHNIYTDPYQQKKAGFHFNPNPQILYEDHPHIGLQLPVEVEKYAYSDYSSSGKMKFLCSFGGKILPRPSDGKLRYVGGETRIISIRKDLNYQELINKTSYICNHPHTIKYQLPDEDLDALISVCSNEDFLHMIDEYHELEKGSQRLRIFLINLNDPESSDSNDSSSIQYVVAVNGMNDQCVHKISSRESLTLQPITGSSLNLMNLTNQNQVIQTPVNVMTSYMSPQMPRQLNYGDRVDQQPKYGSSQHLDLTSYHGNDHGNVDIQTPVNNESAIQPKKFVFPHDKSDYMVQSLMPTRHENPFFVHQEMIKETSQISEADFPPTIITSDFSNQYTEWSQDIKDPHQNQHNIVYPPSNNQSYVVRTESSNAIFNLSSGWHHDTSAEMGIADVYAENCVLLSSNGSGNGSISRSNYENTPRMNDVIITSPAVSAAISNDVSRFGSFVENDSVQEFPVIVEDVTDNRPPGIPSSATVMPYVQDESSDGVLVIRNRENEIVAQSHSKDVKDDKGVKGEHHTTVAEVEAGMHGLQIIKNADLEELRELGSGTFGTVYHGKWRGTDVAIKRIKKSCFSAKKSEQERLTKDFWREAQILSRLHHPNVVALYGVVPDGPGGTLSTVTEYMVNGSLRHVLLRKDKSFDRRKRLLIMQDAAIGMEYLHWKNIVHFDLKCENLLVNMGDPHRPVCKVGDFGLSRIKRNTLVSGGVRGTLPWMAPELLNGSSTRVSEKVDVFSFGIAMWEILTGEEPYADMHCGAIIGGIVSNTLRPSIPERCDHGWKTLMEECWSYDPTDRPTFTEITHKFQIMSKRYNHAKR